MTISVEQIRQSLASSGFKQLGQSTLLDIQERMLQDAGSKRAKPNLIKLLSKAAPAKLGKKKVASAAANLLAMAQGPAGQLVMDETPLPATKFTFSNARPSNDKAGSYSSYKQALSGFYRVAFETMHEGSAIAGRDPMQAFQKLRMKAAHAYLADESKADFDSPNFNAIIYLFNVLNQKFQKQGEKAKRSVLPGQELKSRVEEVAAEIPGLKFSWNQEAKQILQRDRLHFGDFQKVMSCLNEQVHHHFGFVHNTVSSEPNISMPIPKYRQRHDLDGVPVVSDHVFTVVGNGVPPGAMYKDGRVVFSTEALISAEAAYGLQRAQYKEAQAGKKKWPSLMQYPSLADRYIKMNSFGSKPKVQNFREAYQGILNAEEFAHAKSDLFAHAVFKNDGLQLSKEEMVEARVATVLKYGSFMTEMMRRNASKMSDNEYFEFCQSLFEVEGTLGSFAFPTDHTYQLANILNGLIFPTPVYSYKEGSQPRAPMNPRYMLAEMIMLRLFSEKLLPDGKALVRQVDWDHLQNFDFQSENSHENVINNWNKFKRGELQDPTGLWKLRQAWYKFFDERVSSLDKYAQYQNNTEIADAAAEIHAEHFMTDAERLKALPEWKDIAQDLFPIQAERRLSIAKPPNNNDVHTIGLLGANLFLLPERAGRIKQLLRDDASFAQAYTMTAAAVRAPGIGSVARIDQLANLKVDSLERDAVRKLVNDCFEDWKLEIKLGETEPSSEAMNTIADALEKYGIVNTEFTRADFMRQMPKLVGKTYSSFIFNPATFAEELCETAMAEANSPKSAIHIKQARELRISNREFYDKLLAAYKPLRAAKQGLSKLMAEGEEQVKSQHREEFAKLVSDLEYAQLDWFKVSRGLERIFTISSRETELEHFAIPYPVIRFLPDDSVNEAETNETGVIGLQKSCFDDDNYAITHELTHHAAFQIAKYPQRARAQGIELSAAELQFCREVKDQIESSNAGNSQFQAYWDDQEEKAARANAFNSEFPDHGFMTERPQDDGAHDEADVTIDTFDGVFV